MPKPKLSDAVTKPKALTPEAAEEVKAATEATSEDTATEERAEDTTGTDPPAEPETEAAAETDDEPEATGHTLADYMTAFGDAEGAVMFRDGVSFESASAKAIETLRGELHDTKAENQQLKQRVKDLVEASGEVDPVQTGSDADSGKVSFSEAARRTKS